MTPLTQEFVESCPIEGGFRMRGLEMTRLEVFIDAAFTFAVFISACLLVFVQMYRYAARMKTELLLNDFELFESRSLAILWFGAAVIGMFCVLLAMTLPRQWVPYSGFSFMLLGAWFPLIRTMRRKRFSVS